MLSSLTYRHQYPLIWVYTFHDVGGTGIVEEKHNMKRPVWICLVGMFVALTGETGIILSFISQIAPETLSMIFRLSWSVLLVAGPILSAAYVDWKRKVNPAAGVGLFLIGSVGYFLLVQFVIGHAFLSTLIEILLIANFSLIAWAGICLAVFALYRTLGKPNPTDPAGQSSG